MAHKFVNSFVYLSHPLSSMVMGTNALVVKPAQSIAPMISVFILNHFGYERYKSGDLELVDDLKMVMFSMACLLPVVIGTGQLLCWQGYGIRDSHAKCVKEEELDIEQML